MFLYEKWKVKAIVHKQGWTIGGYEGEMAWPCKRSTSWEWRWKAMDARSGEDERRM